MRFKTKAAVDRRDDDTHEGGGETIVVFDQFSRQS